MVLPLFYTSYKHSKLATMFSVIGALYYVGAFIMVVGWLLNYQNFREGGSFFESVMAGLAFAIWGFANNRLGAFIAKRKAKKLIGKAAAAMGSATPVAHATPVSHATSVAPAVPAVRHCPKCGAEIEDGDAFCTQCGTRI